MLELDDLKSKESKCFITVIYEDKENRVTWFSDTSIDDVRFAIMCACDSLVDGEFEILNDKAKTIDIETVQSFVNGTTFFLRKKNNSKPTNILLDGNRKLSIEIDPLSHIESQVALKYMLIGSNLLKHTRKGYPHIRMFQLSSDLKRVLWYSKSKPINEAQISFDKITEIIIGQKSENFLRYPLKMLEDFSFSIYYSVDNKSNTLDLTCKDEREFDLWIIGFKALHSTFTNKIINKNNLLSHSKCFKDLISSGNIRQSSKFLMYDINDNSSVNGKVMKDHKLLDTPKSKKNLEKFIISRNLNQYDLAKLFLSLCEKIQYLRNEVNELSEKEDFSTGEMKQDYKMVFAEEAIVDDLDTQKNQMIKLYKVCHEAIGNHLQEYLWFTKEYKLNLQYNIDEEDFDDFMKLIATLETYLQMSFALDDNFKPEKINVEYFIKELDIKLWKIEIDLENVGDIINRFKAPHNKGFIEKIKEIFKFL